MSGVGKVNLKVAIIESDRYALNAINAYLAWDRRTRVKIKADSLEQFWLELGESSPSEYADVLILDANHVGGANALDRAIRNLRDAIPGLMVICLAQSAELDLLYAAAHAGARAYLLKQDVRLHIGWAIYRINSLDKRTLVISSAVVAAGEKLDHWRLRGGKTLPGPRQYLFFTKRLREAIVLYAIEGMPMRLVADEMGISVNTARDYIKQAYRILETYDECLYPNDMNQQELAFMRITALDHWNNGQE